VTDARALFAAYARQRAELGEGEVTLDAPFARRAAVPAGPAAPLAVSGPAHVAPPAAAGAKRAPDWRKDAPPIPPRGIVIPSPAKDLFTPDVLASASLDDIATLARACTKCGLCQGRKQAVPGEGAADARLVVVGEGPGATEDETGRPFVGRAGELLTDILAAISLPRESVFICNIVKCRPPSNRTPQQDEIDACVPYLYRQLALLKPAVILAMGATAAGTLLNSRQSLGSLRGAVHEFRGTPLIVTYHPAALLRNPNWKKPTWDDVRIARQLLDRAS
jgi:uracil-DNA glycosylase family 4